jgi:hypothetical protein
MYYLIWVTYNFYEKSSRRIFMLIKSPMQVMAVQREDPPYDKNSRGIPVIGMIPITIPTLTIKWKKNINRIPEAM